MPRILLIENDSGFAADMARVLTSAGYETQVVGEGREGLATASAWRPHAIVLCVELPDTSGYLVCQRLKKDEALRDIPLVLTSADATEKSFADHQKLKVRADEYLLKPYVPDALLEILSRLGVPQGTPGEDEELVRLEDGDASSRGELPALDLETFGDETPSRGAPARMDHAAAPTERDEDDLFLDNLTGLGDERPAAAPPREDDLEDETLASSGLELDIDGDLADRPVGADDLDAAADSLPDDSRDPSLDLDRLGLAGGKDPGRGGRGALDLDDGMGGDDDPLRALSDEDEKTDSHPLRAVPEPKVRPASTDFLRSAGIKLLDDEDDGTAVTLRSDSAPPPVRPSPPAVVPAPGPPPGSTRTMPALHVPRPGGPQAFPPPGPPPAPAPASAHQAERLERELAEAREALSDARSEILSHDSEVRQLRDKVASVNRRAEQAEAQVREARTEAGEAKELRARLEAAEKRAESAAGARAEAERRAAEAERRFADAERRAAEAATRADAVQAEVRKRADAEAGAAKQVEALRAELEAARAGAEALGAELDALKAQGLDGKASAALEKRLAELETANAKNEDRVLKAYQKIRGDEKVRDKVRKALAIASQLLDEGMAPDPSAERERRTVGPPPRDPKT